MFGTPAVLAAPKPAFNPNALSGATQMFGAGTPSAPATSKVPPGLTPSGSHPRVVAPDPLVARSEAPTQPVPAVRDPRGLPAMPPHGDPETARDIPSVRLSGEGGDARAGKAAAAFPMSVGRKPASREPDLGEELRAANQRRVFIAVFALVIVGGLAVGIPSVRDWAASRKNAIPPEALQAHQQAFSQMRRDDPKALQEAGEALAKLAAGHPKYLEAHSTLLIALALRLDYLRIEVKRLAARADGINERVARLQREKAPADWENRVNALLEEVAALKKESEPLSLAAASVDQEATSALAALQAVTDTPTPEEEVLLTRGLAVYAGVKGSDEAIAFSARYKSLLAHDGWDAVAYGEYAVNAKVARETIAAAGREVDEVLAKDSSFIRAYVVRARLWMAEKDFEKAAAPLETVEAFNPNHSIAKALLAHAREQKQTAE